MTADAAHVAAVAEALCHTYDDDPDGLGGYTPADFMREAIVAVETLTPLIRAQVAAEIRAMMGWGIPVSQSTVPVLSPNGPYVEREHAARIAEGTA